MEKYKVTIDAGHGYTSEGKFDPGVVHAQNLSEFNLNCYEAMDVAKYLYMFGCDVDLRIYDNPDKALFLSDRGYLGRNSDIFVSIHHNAHNRTVQGSECLIHTGAKIEDERLAHYIERECAKSLRINSRGVKKGNYAVLSKMNNTKAASCIVESFFMDSVTYPKIFKFAEDAALAISIGIMKFLKERGGR